MRQLAANPWDSLHEKFPVGMTVEGRVRNLTDFGAFIEIEDGIDGLVHVSNLSWTKRVKHPSEVLKKGDRVKARRAGHRARQAPPVARRQAASARRLGIFLRDTPHWRRRPWQGAARGRFGAFVEIAEGVEGLCHKSEAADGNGQPHARSSPASSTTSRSSR